ncbi:inosine-5-monophosphate dehydrogenase [Halobacteriales archaeon QS_1_68_17]|nr:MAG: inosine-5-monophosphate dehydrogenase [Halobacteriales archaeon QS_1_68_17]
MNGDVTVRELMTREYVGASEGDDLVEAAELMLENGDDAVVVLRGNDAVGMVTERDVVELVVDGGDPSAASVEQAMRPEPPTIGAGETVSAATDLMTARSVRHLLVVDGDEPVGVLSEHDVVGASTLAHGVESGEGRPAGSEVMLADAADASPNEEYSNQSVDEEYSNQGICEVCGTLTRNLSSFNGQLVCSDCKNV